MSSRGVTRSADLARTEQATGARPVMLVTFDVPADPDAAAFAVDAAVESGQPLIVVNVVDMPIRPMTWPSSTSRPQGGLPAL